MEDLFIVRVISQQGHRRAVDFDFPTASSEAEAVRSSLGRMARELGLEPSALEAEVVGRYPVLPPSSGGSVNERA